MTELLSPAKQIPISTSNQLTQLEKTIIQLTTSYYNQACCDITNLAANKNDAAFASGFMECYLQIRTLTELSQIKSSGISESGALTLTQIGSDAEQLYAVNEQTIIKALKQT